MTARHCVVAACLAFAAISLPAADEHGKIDVFAAPGVTLAWAVARGPSEAATHAVIRVVTDPAVFGALSVTGRDPFTQAERVWMKATPTSGRIDVRIARAGFGDFPRTEFGFHAAAPSPDAKPKLQVFYLGLPDTTPEFDDPAKMDAYLDERIAKARLTP